MKTLRTLLAMTAFSIVLISCTKEMPTFKNMYTGKPVGFSKVNNPFLDSPSDSTSSDTTTAPPAVNDSIPVLLSVTGFYGTDEKVTIYIDGQQIYQASSKNGNVVIGDYIEIAKVVDLQQIQVSVEAGSDVNGKEIQIRKAPFTYDDILYHDWLNPMENRGRLFEAHKADEKYAILVLTRV